MKGLLTTLAIGGAAFDLLAAPFSNLDFEMANTNNLQVAPSTPSILSGFGAIDDLLPHWSLRSRDDSNTVGLVNFNYPSTGGLFGGATINVFSREYLTATGFPNILTGNYWLGIQTTFVPLFMSQTGDVPVNATELKIIAYYDSSNFLRTFFNGVEITDSQTFSNGAVIINADISAFSGLSSVKLELEMGLAHAPDFTQSAGIGIDRIEFGFPDPPPVAPRISQGAVSYGTNGFSFFWDADIASKYQVELATNIPAAWQPIGSPVTSTNGTFYFTDAAVTNQSNAQRFYRLRALP